VLDIDHLVQMEGVRAAGRDREQAPARRDPQRNLLTLLQRQANSQHQHPPARGPSSRVQQAQCCNHRLRASPARQDGGRSAAGEVIAESTQITGVQDEYYIAETATWDDLPEQWYFFCRVHAKMNGVGTALAGAAE
jgi:hypothetical protein